MNCKQVQSLLNAYLDREMTGRETLAIRRHLEECRECRVQADELSQVKSVLGALPNPEPSTDFEARLLSAIHAERPPLAPVTPRWRPVLAFVSVTGVSMALTFVALSYTRVPPTTGEHAARDAAVAVEFEVNRDRSFGWGSPASTPVFSLEDAPR